MSSSQPLENQSVPRRKAKQIVPIKTERQESEANDDKSSKRVDEDDENDEIIAALRALAAPVVNGSTASSQQQSPPRTNSFVAPPQQQQSESVANPNPKKRSAPAGGAVQQRGRPAGSERERDFKWGATRRVHHVDSAILSTPPTWTDTECATMLVQILQRAELRAVRVRELALAVRRDVDGVRRVVADVAADSATLSRICCASVMPLASLLCYFRALWSLKRQSQQARALQAACDGGTVAYELVWMNELPPPPTIPFKGKSGQVPQFRFQLFAANGTAGELPPLPPTATLVASTTCVAKEFTKAAAPLSNASVRLSADGSGDIGDLVIEESSRMEFVTLSFALASAGAVASKVEPIESPPMIVVTNESQWPGAAKRLLWHDTFVDEQAIPWPLFANMLNMHMICGLQQSLDSAVRPLFDWEMRYLHGSARWFAGERLITREAALSFWNFFGAALTILRFKRHIFTMWSRGALLGFVSREKASQLLAGEREGTFCIRFSESLPGAFAVAYVSGDAEQPGDATAVSRVTAPGAPASTPPTLVKHFLILPTQLGHNRTLPDFLRDKSDFKHLCSLRSPDSDVETTVAAKDVVLAQFYKHDRLEGKQFPGYINLTTDS